MKHERNVAILCYHRVAKLDNDLNMLCVSPENFEDHIRIIKENYDVLSLADPIQSWKNGVRDAVVLTFDDGYYDLHANALPVIEEYGIPATMFVSTANIGKNQENWNDIILRAFFSPNIYNEEISLSSSDWGFSFGVRSLRERVDAYSFYRNLILRVDIETKENIVKQLIKWAGLEEDIRIDRRILSIKELQELSASSLVSIGAHTVHHVALKGLSRKEQIAEIRDSKRRLEDIIKCKVELFSYPFGQREDYDDLSVEILKQCGFTKAVTTVSGLIDRLAMIDAFQLPRVNVRNYSGDGFARFLNKTFDGNEDSFVKKRISSRVEYVGRVSNDSILMDSCSKILIWGCGYQGKKLFEELARTGLNRRVIGWGDNNEDLWGNTVEGLPVFSEKEINNTIEEDTIVLVRSKYDIEIAINLLDRGFDRIHILNRE